MRCISVLVLWVNVLLGWVFLFFVVCCGWCCLEMFVESVNGYRCLLLLYWCWFWLCDGIGCCWFVVGCGLVWWFWFWCFDGLVFGIGWYLVWCVWDCWVRGWWLWFWLYWWFVVVVWYGVWYLVFYWIGFMWLGFFCCRVCWVFVVWLVLVWCFWIVWFWW